LLRLATYIFLQFVSETRCLPGA